MNDICNGLLNVGDLSSPDFVNKRLHFLLADLAVTVLVELIEHSIECFIVKFAPFTELAEVLSNERFHLKLRKQARVILVICRPYFIDEAILAGRLRHLSLVLKDLLPVS
jgi:hypothetical protein